MSLRQLTKRDQHSYTYHHNNNYDCINMFYIALYTRKLNFTGDATVYCNNNNDMSTSYSLDVVYCNNLRVKVSFDALPTPEIPSLFVSPSHPEKI